MWSHSNVKNLRCKVGCFIGIKKTANNLAPKFKYRHFSCSFFWQHLYPYDFFLSFTEDKNPKAEPGTPYEYMTPLDIAAYEGKKEVYDFIIEQIGAENLGEIPEFVHCLDCGSESEDSEDSEDSEGFPNTFYEDLNEALIALNTEYSDDYETGSGRSGSSGDHKIL